MGQKLGYFFIMGNLHIVVFLIQIRLSLKNFFTYVCKYILDYEPGNSVSKLSQKPRVVLKFK
jgi:hypothetical protein